jgi:hypothetical protein
LLIREKRVISAVKMVDFISNRKPCIVLRGHWCRIGVLNICAPTEDKIDSVKDRFQEELEHVFDRFPKYHMKILLGDFILKVGKEDILKHKLGMKVYTKLLMMMELE